MRKPGLLGVVVLALGGFLAAVGCSTDPTDPDTDPSNPDNKGGPPSCSNGVRDGDEAGTDCGGVCPAQCSGAGCTSGTECASGICTDGVCAAPPEKVCGVGVSAAPACADGQPCELDGDCDSVRCVAGRCEPPLPGPSNGRKDNDETDVDCGGPNAPACDNGKACEANTDCKDAYCADGTKLCTEPRSDDGVKNGDETDVDCGGTSGNRCAEGKTCAADGDCLGACRFDDTCVDAPSCKPKLGGATCGANEVGSGGEVHESCCRTLEVPGFADAARPGKTVYLDKYEITSGRIRAFMEYLEATNGGNLKAWVAANLPPMWSADFDQFLATSKGGPTIAVPHKPTSGTEAPPWNRNVGTDYAFNQQLFVYVHGHNCNNNANSYGYPTYWYPPNIQALNNSDPRADGVISFDPRITVPAKDYLDVKSATCIPNVILAAFCHWDGGQLATDEVLDYVTDAPAGLGSSAGCGSRCAPIDQINASLDGGQVSGRYFFPYFDGGVTSEGTSRIAAPGRMQGDVVRINAGDEPWMDLHGNVHEAVLDVTGATFTGKFGLKYRGIAYSSARAGGNSPTGNLTYPEYKAAYSGGRCMRFK